MPLPAAAAKTQAGEARTVSELATEMLRRTTALFLAGPRPAADEQLDLYDQMFARLMPQVATEVLAELSTALAVVERAPYATVRLLAVHPELRVAGPVLAKAAVLTERDLAEFIRASSPAHLVAVASRRGIGDALTAQLIARGFPPVRMALAQNLTAKLSEDSYRSLFKVAERDEDLAEKLALRTDLPAKLSRAFVAAASEAARARFIKAAPPATRATLQAAPTRSAAAAMRAMWDYEPVKAEVAALNRTGKLGDSAVNRFCVTGDFPAVIAALALLCVIPIETVESLLDESRMMDLLLACKAARLSWATTGMILKARPGCDAIAAEDFEEARKRFEKLVLSEAQWKVRGLQTS
ncbi:conserved hypothetical protein; putative signal peptide [Bradyrhizobium sp. ORS 278]|uniref:DUF2336 domain-containing protein n=1 Tax=Bradyrhizobium sp. (strain ORS 278) TaxID=114615 RepID=UPI0001507B25|nr:DUF2336 domain-containing protein [Bradyrhizobium sp. ORS 278]CAL74187.1 conserved hypothetical protein; putative signal peptide [Bradyrhizobium sp. ORS 278]